MFFERPEAGRNAVLLQVYLRNPSRAPGIGPVGYHQSGDDLDSLAECAELARTAQIHVVDVVTARRTTPHPRWYVGEGKLEELEGLLAGILFFYQFCGDIGRVDRSVPEQIAGQCEDLDFYRRRIDTFWEIEDDGYSDWAKECSLKD